METSRLTSKYQATIPQEIRKFLGLGKGDIVRFAIENDKVVLEKDMLAEMTEEEEQRGWLALAEQTLAEEWLSEEDEKLFKDW